MVRCCLDIYCKVHFTEDKMKNIQQLVKTNSTPFVKYEYYIKYFYNVYRTILGNVCATILYMSQSLLVFCSLLLSMLICCFRRVVEFDFELHRFFNSSFLLSHHRTVYT